MCKYKNRYFYPWCNHTKCCMDGKRIGCLQIVSQHVPIYLQQFPSYSNCKCKKSLFLRTAADIFVSPGDVPATITQYVASMERQFNACQTPHRLYVSTFNSFRKSKNCYFYHIFVSPEDVPGAMTLNVVWLEREFDAYKLSRCMCPSNYYRFLKYSEIFVKKSHFIIPPLHSTPPLGGFPSEYRHPLWDGNCANPTQNPPCC